MRPFEYIVPFEGNLSHFPCRKSCNFVIFLLTARREGQIGTWEPDKLKRAVQFGARSDQTAVAVWMAKGCPNI